MKFLTLLGQVIFFIFLLSFGWKWALILITILIAFVVGAAFPLFLVASVLGIGKP